MRFLNSSCCFLSSCNNLSILFMRFLALDHAVQQTGHISFNSLYEILMPIRVQTFNIPPNFQFSLWDSIKTPMLSFIGWRTLSILFMRFSILFVILFRFLYTLSILFMRFYFTFPHYWPAETFVFQFSLWDSYFNFGRQCWYRL